MRSKSNSEERKTLHCIRCGATWKQRFPDRLPSVCAKCNSVYWNRPRVRNLETQNCGNCSFWDTNNNENGYCKSKDRINRYGLMDCGNRTDTKSYDYCFDFYLPKDEKRRLEGKITLDYFGNCYY